MINYENLVTIIYSNPEIQQTPTRKSFFNATNVIMSQTPCLSGFSE